MTRFISRIQWTGRFMAILLLILAGIVNAAAQVPEDFGYNRIQAVGGRPLLVILTEFQGSAALRSNAVQYFDDITFNTYAPASNPSLQAYFIENSNGRFNWQRAGAGVMGPYQFNAEDIGTEKDWKLSRITLALKAAAADGFDFAQYDENGDGSVKPDELSIMIVDNIAADNALSTGAANRRSDPACFKPDNSDTNLCLQAALIGHYASFMSMAHELLHSLGVPSDGDIYGSNDNSQGYSTMGATVYIQLDDMRTYHLDPFHKMQLGWVEPKLYSIHVPLSETIGASNLIHGDEPVLLYSPHDLNEYFMLEYRTTAAAGGAGYDADLPANGLVIWQVKVDDNYVPIQIPSQVDPVNKDLTVFTLGAPGLSRGHGDAWAVGDNFVLTGYQIIPYTLRWLDGADSGVQIKVGRTSDSGSKLDIFWGTFAPPITDRFKIIYYSQSWFVGDIGQFSETGDHAIVSTYAPGPWSWTNVVSDQSGIFYYHRGSGTARLASVDANGNYKIVKDFPAGYFGAGWSHIVSHRGYLFFYSTTNGMAAIGTLSANGFKQHRFYPAYSLGTGWTHIVSTQNGLLFYAQGNGMGVVGDFEFSYFPCSAFCFPVVSDVRLKSLSFYPAGSFSNGWSSITDTTNGVLFYRKSDGLQVMADIERTGRVVTRMKTFQFLKPGYSSVLSAGDDILFYNSSNGDGALAEVLKADITTLSISVGRLAIKRDFTNYFNPGYSHIVAGADPKWIH